jgi:hypothetical protein
MDFKPARLRRGEIVAGIGGLALLVLLFAAPWLSARSGHTSTGWDGLSILRWLSIVLALTALALAFTQVLRSAPAVPVTLSVFVTVLGALTVILLVIRLLTTGSSLEVGAWLGLLAAIAITLGGFLSMREEDGSRPDPEHPIETVSLGAGHRS